MGLTGRELEDTAMFEVEVYEDTGFGRALDEAPYLNTPLRRSKKDPPPPL